MYLKYLDLIGFKSFAEKTRLEFEPGITAVIGPNGCGKSNVIDALRWCLGEMSAKSLRSSVLLDVIFSGTESRNPQNMAEVSLTFDNSDHLLPIDYSEVTVARRLYRSGESEYFINKTQCRLRDIREMFLDTGMGEDGYSIMEQGKVEYILQAKPEERRELFEEAAGVSKYKARRDEAQRKLEKVDIDLSRLADVIALTKEQMDRLEASVKKAQQYQRLEQELKTLELQDLLFQAQNIRESLAAFEVRLQNAQQTVQTLTTQTHSGEARLQETRLALTQKQEEFSGAGTRKAAFDGEKKLCEERLRNASLRQAELEQRRAALMDESTKDRTQLDELLKREETLSNARASSESSHEVLRNSVEEMERSSKTLHAQLKTQEAALTNLGDEIIECNRLKTQRTQTLHQLRTQATRTEYELQNLYKDRTKSQLKRENLKTQAQTYAAEEGELKKDRDTLGAEQLRAEEKLQSFLIEERNAQNERGKVNDKIKGLEGRLQALGELGASDPYVSGLQAILSQNFPGVHGPVGRLLESPATHKDMVRAALGERVNYFIAETQGDAEKAIQYLSEQKKGRARFVILDRLPPEGRTQPLGSLRGERALIEMVRYDPSFERAIRALMGGLWVSGSAVYGEGVISGGVDPAHWQDPRDVNAREEMLEAKKREEESLILKLDERVLHVREQLGRANADKASVASKMNETEVSLRLAERLGREVQDTLRLVEEEMGVIQKQILRAQDELQQMETALQKDETGLKDHDARETELKDRHESLSQEVQSLLAACQQSGRELAAKQGELKAREDIVQMAEQNWAQNQTHISGLRSSLKTSEEELVRLAANLEESVATQKEMGEKLPEFVGLLMNHEEELRRIRRERDEIQTTAEEGEKALEAIREQLAQARENLTNERMSQSQEQSRVESILHKIKESYQLTLEEALQTHAPATCEPGELEHRRRRLQNMGPVNLAAPEEHAQLQSRYDFLMTQQQDLLKAKEDLNETIMKVNATTMQSFRETFDKVRESFKTIYAQLFEGGEADLRLTNEEDPLNAGVDIFAQPPGKKLQHISLLSGGEKALTANALLFAFFQTRPAPLALLDEVDAPLDEANVVRFTSLLKHYGQKTQFLIISHNKRTMEIADTLYGVTMEEHGVSKILSARLTKKQPAETAVAAS
jgi:chromosome segregation protein